MGVRLSPRALASQSDEGTTLREQWINLVMACVQSVSFSIIINGEWGDLFQPQRGIRQGCPLPPYLFILCTEGDNRIHWVSWDTLSDSKSRGGHGFRDLMAFNLA